MSVKLHTSVFDPAVIRADFPILSRKVNGNNLIYFDNGATSQKPKEVIEAIVHYYSYTNSNIHRGVHTLSRESTEAFEAARKTVAAHFNIANDQQLIFTSGTTESINTIVNGIANGILKEGDEIILSSYEHHSNILAWQLWAEKNKGKLKIIPLKTDQSLDLDALESLVTPQTKVLSVTHVSNTLGLITDMQRVQRFVQKHNLIWVVDGAQSAPHMQIDLQKLDPDFYVCSAHKMYGPTGTGLLYLGKKWLTDLPHSRPGGGTIKTVSFEKTEYAEGSLRFEAGTPNIEGVIGFAAAINYINKIGINRIAKHEHDLVQYAQTRLLEIPEIEVYGQHKEKAAVISFNMKGVHPFDVGTLLDKYGIAVRTGHHCTQPLMNILCVPGTIRISFAVYNTLEEIDFFIEKLKKVISMLK